MANYWFKGSNEIREQISKGDLAWTLRKGPELNPETSGPDLNENERQVIQDLGILHKYMSRLMNKLLFLKEQGPQYISTARNLAKGILDNQKRLKEILEKIDNGHVINMKNSKSIRKGADLDFFSATTGNC